MSEWELAYSEWNQFIEQVEQERKRLFCSISSAWFRGQKDSDWDLSPSLFRLLSRSNADTQKEIKLISNEISEIKNTWKMRKQKLSNIRFKLQKATNKDDSHLLVQKEYDNSKELLKELKQKLDSKRQKLAVLKAVGYGEQRAFIDFSFRSGKKFTSSWETLAVMQHYNAPTRLLDWTEVLAIALFFALEDYFHALDKYWYIHDEEKTIKDNPFPFILPKGIKATPCIWIMNPYFLARKSMGKNEILDPTLDSKYDYYDCFFKDFNWDFKFPTPIYPPWLNPRIAAQQGMFIVQGLDKTPVNLQLNGRDNILSKIEISPYAAVYGVKHLRTFFNIDYFTNFRDLDNLGKRIKSSFLLLK